MDFNVKDYGAVGDGVKMNTAAIQSAIDACANAGGGVVVVPAGAFLTGGIELKDNVTLRLAADAILLGSKNVDDYPLEWTCEQLPFFSCLIHARGRRNVRIEGSGTIDGQGAISTNAVSGGELEQINADRRPKICYFVECPNMVIRDVTLRNGGSWAVHLVACDNLRIDGITIHNRLYICTDGLDIDSCQDVMISNCNFDCGDDVIALKNTIMRPCRNIVVTNCVMTTWCAAFRYGPESLAGFENIAVSNCIVHHTYGCGIKLQMVEGGRMENLTFDNIVMEDVTGPFSMKLGWWERIAGEPYPPNPGILRNVMISNVRATVVKEVLYKHYADRGEPFLSQCPTGSGITGAPGYNIENLIFDNIHITNPGGGTREDGARRELPELVKAYPEYAIFGQFPAYGFYFRHAKGIALRNVRFDLDSPDARPILVCDDVEDLEVDGLRGPCTPDCESFIRLQQTRQAQIRGCRAMGALPNEVVRVEGDKSGRIDLI